MFIKKWINNYFKKIHLPVELRKNFYKKLIEDIDILQGHENYYFEGEYPLPGSAYGGVYDTIRNKIEEYIEEECNV